MEKPLAWLKGEVKTPPFSAGARIEAGTCSEDFSRARDLGFLTLALCQRSLPAATSFGFETATTSGESSTGLIPTPS